MKIAAVVITFRRRQLLLESIPALLRQTRAPDAIVVVDNAREKDLPGLLQAEFGPAVTCLSAAENLGPAGAFGAAAEWSWRRGYDWVWQMDEDCEPLPDALEQLLVAFGRLEETPAGLATCHLTPGGEPIGSGAGRFNWRTCRLELLRAEECTGVRPVDTISGSGMFLNLEYGSRCGLHDARLFWLEDADLCWRLAQQGGRFYHVGASRMFRKKMDNHWSTRRLGYPRPPVDSLWRTYYVLRNDVRFYLRARPGALTRMRMWRRYLHALAGVLILDDKKWRRARLITRAFADGLAGRLGKTIDPEQFAGLR